MPNWVRNRIIFKTEKDLKIFLETVQKKSADEVIEKSQFDFNWIVSEPIDENTCRQFYGEKYIANDKSHISKIENREWFQWYEWRLDFWGTKWNACEVTYEGNCIWFDTAWSEPTEVYKTLVENFPQFDVEIFFAEEQGGYYCGEVNNKKRIVYPSYSDAAYEAYNELWGEYYYKTEEDNKWHAEDDNGVFWAKNEYHFYNTVKGDLETAKKLYKEYGEEFISCLVEANCSNLIKTLRG